MKKLPITILIITLNEAHNLRTLLPSLVQMVQEVFVVDSLSCDDTVDVALSCGARVVQRPFCGFSDQWNFALKLPVTSEWTMKLDPDERISASLLEELRAVTEIADNPIAGYCVRRRLWYMGRPLSVVDNPLRLWKTGVADFGSSLVNERCCVKGLAATLGGFLEHLDSPDLHHWYEKQNRYSTMEAIVFVTRAPLADSPRFWGSWLQRRMWLKENYWKLPMKHYIYRIWLYFFTGVWRDGKVGWIWARQRAEVMRMREYKIQETRWRKQLPQIPRGKTGAWHTTILASALQAEMEARSNECLRPKSISGEDTPDTFILTK